MALSEVPLALLISCRSHRDGATDGLVVEFFDIVEFEATVVPGSGP